MILTCFIIAGAAAYLVVGILIAAGTVRLFELDELIEVDEFDAALLALFWPLVAIVSLFILAGAALGASVIVLDEWLQHRFDRTEVRK